MTTQEPFSGVLGLSSNPLSKTVVSFPEHLKIKKMIEKNIVAIHAGGGAGGKITLGGYDKSHIHNSNGEPFWLNMNYDSQEMVWTS